MPSKAPVVRNDSLLATDAEKHATSKSLYGDHKARISANVSSIHDRVRIKAYQSIFSSLKGKNVLHMSCGIGLISMMAARAMAKHVVAIDTSSIVQAAAVVAKQNNLENITFVQGSVQTARLPIEKFDVVLCEWMGSFLTNEAVLDDLFYCRDHLLAEGGMICPNKSSLHVVGISDYNYIMDTVEYWDNVYGFNMQPMKELVMEEASTCHIPRHCVATSPCMVHTIEIEKLSPEARAFSAPYSIQATRKGTIHFLTFYVDCTFTHPTNPGANFLIGFNPGGTNAWTEVSVPLREPIPVFPGDSIKGTVKVTPGTKRCMVEITETCSNAIAAVDTSGRYNYQY
jgi:predicted RNA methylase